MVDNNQINGDDVDISNSLNNSQSITSAFNEAIQQARVSKKGGLDKIDDEGLNELKRQADELIKGGLLPPDKIKEINDAIKEAITKNTALKKSDLGSSGAKKSSSSDQEEPADTEPEEGDEEEPTDGGGETNQPPVSQAKPSSEQQPANETTPEEAGQEAGDGQEQPVEEASEVEPPETPEAPTEGGEPSSEQQPANEAPKTETPPTEGSNTPEGESPAQAGNKPQQPAEEEPGKTPKGGKPKGGWGAKTDDGKNDMAGKEKWENELEKAKQTKQKILEAKQKIQAAKAKVDEAMKMAKTAKTIKSAYNVYEVACVAGSEIIVPLILIWLSWHGQLFNSGLEIVPGKPLFKGFGPKALKILVPPLSLVEFFALLLVDVVVIFVIFVVVIAILFFLGYFGSSKSAGLMKNELMNNTTNSAPATNVNSATPANTTLHMTNDTFNNN